MSEDVLALRVCIGSDHRGIGIKTRLLQTLHRNGYSISDEGAGGDKPVDYPDFATSVARKVSHGESDRGILICGTGIGMSITANKFPGVRAAPCYDSVMAEIGRRHNDVNVICLPGDIIGDRTVEDLVLLWLRTEFEGGRHARRLEKIAQIEAEYFSR
jgi:ribose 5-phosphate isomerase B